MDGMSSLIDQLVIDGYAIVPQVLTAAEVQFARQECAQALAGASAGDSVLADRDKVAYGARNLLQLWPQVIDLVHTSKLANFLIEILDSNCGLVRGLYFDEPPGHSWALPWHRDLTIAVKRHGVLGRFKKPTTKAGVPHVEAPAGLLATMLTVRIHLDDVTDANGPLRVMPGSHNPPLTPHHSPLTLHCHAGDAILMRPMILHASGHSAECNPEHRRTIHLEFASSGELGDGYEWREFVRVR
jgi:hypothetical protein